MRKAIFIAGVAIGFIFGARAGRDTYDKIMAYAKQTWEHPTVVQARSTAQSSATGIAKQAQAKAPGAMSSAASTVSSQVPKFVQNVRQTASDKMPSKLGKLRSSKTTKTTTTTTTTSVQPDDVAPDGNLIYPADDGTTTSGTGRVRVTPDTP